MPGPTAAIPKARVVEMLMDQAALCRDDIRNLTAALERAQKRLAALVAQAKAVEEHGRIPDLKYSEVA